MDIFNLPRDFRGDVFINTSGNTFTNGTNLWLTWSKPKGLSMAHIYIVGAGAGGGGGASAAAGNARGGGGGGGSSGSARLTVPLSFLPDILFYSIGQPGHGGAADTDGTDANGTIVSVAPFWTTSNFLLWSDDVNAVPGAKGTTSAAGAGGAAGAVASIANTARGGLGIYSLAAGQAGASGGAQTGAIGGAVAIPTAGNSLHQGGAGGAGTTSADFAGGVLTKASNSIPSLFSEFMPPAAPAGSNDGSSGVILAKPFYGMGGSGGGSSNTSIGGNGGKGGIGGGGGGGGGGTTGGKGGDGGDGCIIIICW